MQAFFQHADNWIVLGPQIAEAYTQPVPTLQPQYGLSCSIGTHNPFFQIQSYQAVGHGGQDHIVVAFQFKDLLQMLLQLLALSQDLVDHGIEVVCQILHFVPGVNI